MNDGLSSFERVSLRYSSGFWCPRHSVSGVGEALGSGRDVHPAYLRLQLHHAWRLKSFCSGKIGGDGVVVGRGTS